ncbi:MAG: hypothetical protein H2174_06930 [Vampirovibrio sp.]|nr:hypothetical protein [Vampirovibrio sp.]
MKQPLISATHSNEGSTLTPNSPLLKNKKLSSKIKTEQNKSLRPSAEDSFHASKKATSATGNIQPVATKASNKGISLISTALIALTAFGGGIGGVLIARHFNWFELGAKTKTTVTEKIPEAVATALKLGKEATQEQITKKIDDLQSTITKLEDATDKLAKATYDLNQKENDLQASLTTQQEKEAEVVEKNTEIEEQKKQIEQLQQALSTVKDELKETAALFEDSFRRDSEKNSIIETLETKVTQFLTSNKNLVTKLDALNQEIARLRIKLNEEQATGLNLDTQLFGTLNSLPEVWGSDKLSKYVSSALLTPSSLNITEIEHPQNLFNLQQKVYEQLEELDPKYKALQAQLAEMNPKNDNPLEAVLAKAINPLLDRLQNKEGVEAKRAEVQKNIQQLYAISAYLYQTIVAEKQNPYGLITAAEKTILQATVAYNHSRVTAYYNYLNADIGSVERNGSKAIFENSKKLMEQIPENVLPPTLKEVLEEGTIKRAPDSTKLRTYAPEHVEEAFFSPAPRVLTDIEGVFPSFKAQSNMNNVMQVLKERADKERNQFNGEERETVKHQINTLLEFYDDDKSNKDRQTAMLNYATLFVANPLLETPPDRNDGFRTACIEMLRKIKAEKTSGTYIYPDAWFTDLRQRFKSVDELFKKHLPSGQVQFYQAGEYEEFMDPNSHWLYTYKKKLR